MDYHEFRRKLAYNHLFSVREEQHSPDSSGDFRIDALFSDTLPVEITSDRGVVGLSLVHRRLMGRVAVPMVYAVSWAQERRPNRPDTFDSIETAQEYLFGNVDSLALIVNIGLMKTIARDWLLTGREAALTDAR